MKYVFKNKINIIFAVVFDALGAVVFWPFRKRSQKSYLNPRSILIIRLDHIGDCFLATAVPKLIKENMLNTKVIFLTSSVGRALLDHHPFVDEVIVYDAPWFKKQAPACRQGRKEKNISFVEIIKILKKKKIDCAIGLRGDLRENILMWLAGIPQRIGYGITGGGFLLTKEASYRRGAHESEHTTDLLSTLGIQAGNRHARPLQPQIYFSAQEEKEFESKLTELGLRCDQKLVGLQVDAGSLAKEWPKENFRIFLEQFRQRFPQHRLILTGNRLLDELKLTNEVNLIGKTSLRELCLLMKRMVCFIGPDSGPAHIASGLGTPTVFLYSGTNVYEEWRPLSEAARVLRHPVACSPCGLRICNVKGHPCMSDIKVDQVMKVLENIL